MKIRHSQNLKSLLLLMLLALLASDANSQTVVSRARVGGYTEDISYVTSGALKDQVVMTNGNELYAAALSKKSALTRVCRIDNPEMDQFVNGFAFVESEGLFVMNNDPHPNKLYFFDQACGSRGTRTIQYLDGNYRPGHIEGMAYIPLSSPTFPDHLMMVTWDDLNGSAFRLIVMRRDGVQVAEISRPDWPTQFFESGIGDVTFLSPNRLLVSIFHPDSLWIMDFNGNIVSGPLTTGATGLGEGVIQISDGRLVASNYPQDLLVFDKNLNRQPQSDRHDTIGLGLNLPNGIAWDSDSNRFLVLHDTALTTGLAGVASLATTLDSSTSVVDFNAFPNTRQLVYLPQEDLIAALRFNPAPDRAILFFNKNGTLNSQISLSPTSLGQNFGPPGSFTYLPATDEFAVGFNGTPATQALERQKLRIVSRTGTLVRTIDLNATGTGGFNAVEYFQDAQGAERLMFLSAFGRVFITDLDGNSRNTDGAPFGEFNSRVKLGLLQRNDLTAITSGPLAGAFAVTDSSGGEIVIFRMDN
ncbi:MAG TPA: hypothetical protein VJ875_12180 [Pyrinomonadaceae bacterium]|nr:hypothetical protein [Pyrinomonadaceae bacterium]